MSFLTAAVKVIEDMAQLAAREMKTTILDTFSENNRVRRCFWVIRVKKVLAQL
jgi:hypothetical protein